MDDLISRKAVAEKMKNRRDYVGRPSDPDCIIADEPSIPAVPLDKLCEWLAKNACYDQLEDYGMRSRFSLLAEQWKFALTKWMEGLYDYR